MKGIIVRSIIFIVVALILMVGLLNQLLLKIY